MSFSDDLNEFKIFGSQLWGAFKDGNDAAITKAFVCPIFVEVEPTFLLVIEKVEVLLGKFLVDGLLVFASSKGS